ncbi:MAG TPA: hypothetical protein VKF81_00850, partial [Blastocatellia bacterium]|nr:hypothetical protein [Blastocatellia bacterium]
MNNIESQRAVSKRQPQPLLVRSRGFGRLTIKNRLPLVMGLLLLGVIVTSVWVSYDGVKKSSLEASRARLRMLTNNVAAIVQQSVRNVVSTTVLASSDPDILHCLNSPAGRPNAEVRRILLQSLPPQDPNGLQIELWNINRLLV